MHDLVIRGGTLVDGSGAPAREADVAIDGAVVTAVGEVGPGRREIDARGKLVTPGFVDIHTHYDAQVTWDPFLTPSSWHGCTTVVMGSCGVGFAPARADRHAWLIRLMEGVEDIPGAALTEGIRWGWETFPEYLDVLDRIPHAIDFGVSVPHGAVRAYVMDERGAANQEATPEDIAAMYRIVREALEAGALGFSTSRTLMHRSVDGEPVPGTFANDAELFGIGRALRDVKGGVFHVAPDQLALEKEFVWMKALADEIGRPVTFNLNQYDQRPDSWKQVLELLDGAKDSSIFAQVAGRAIGIIMALDGTAHPFLGYPSLMRFSDRSPDERRALMRDPALRAQVLAEQPLDLGEFGNFVTRTFSRMFLVSGEIDYEPGPEKSIAAVAAATGKSPQELAYDQLASGGYIYFPLFNYAGGDLAATHTLHSHPRTLMGLGDAGAHCGAICDGGMPTFMLTHWARDRVRGERFPLEFLVRRQTRHTAEVFGLLDRGLLVPGMKADANVIDLERLQVCAATMAYDLPAGGRRLLQRATGYVATICDGVIISEHDRPTGAMPGRLVRGAQADPRAR
ncbi:MAG: D-aminoacylase [Myxococcales bacterium]|nr:D-aminoacylase [Myxococcales bacterium]